MLTTRKRDKKVLVALDGNTYAKLEKIAEHQRTTTSALIYDTLWDNIDRLYEAILSREAIRYDFDTGYDVITIKEGD